jgi:uncharacterized SAM-binding protein YcdF (DUF218 family)
LLGLPLLQTPRKNMLSKFYSFGAPSVRHTLQLPGPIRRRNAAKVATPASPICNPRVACGLLVVLALTAVWLARDRWLTLVGTVLVERDAVEKADILFLLNGEENSRPFRAVSLYRAGMAPQVVIARENAISRSAFCHGCRSTTEASERVLRMSGIPKSSIVELQISGGVKSTFDEAILGLRYARLRKMRKIIVVTSEFHTRRAKWIFDRVFAGTSVQIMVAATPNGRYSTTTWWLSEDGRIGCWREYLKLAYYLCRYGFVVPDKGVEEMRIEYLG